MQQKLMNVRVRCLTADSIYANNANRKFCTEYGISTSFVRKERAVRDESLRKVLRSELSRERATRLEGSFGTQKQHYSLSRIKARNRKTEILWLFFEIHTANAVLMIVFVHHNVFADKRYFLAINREEFFNVWRASERTPEVDTLSCIHQFDGKYMFQIVHYLKQFGGSIGPHAHMVFLSVAGYNGITAGGVAIHFILAYHRGCCILGNHKA